MDKNYDKTKPLRALLLSAGFGMRLKPITNKIPKSFFIKKLIK